MSTGKKKKTNSRDTQVGGKHYKGMGIQPTEYAYKNKLDPFQFNVVKYVTRFRDKAGIQDLEKAKHYIEMLIEQEKGEWDK